MISWFFLVLLTCLLIHFQVAFTCNWMANTIGGYLYFVVLSTLKGLSYLLYPLCGWIAEICSSKFKLIQCSFVLMLISSITISIDGLLQIMKKYEFEGKLIVTQVLFVVSGLIALGLYEANAIQFGMDQMLDASSEQLSSFIHWYFWCIDIGSLIIYSAVVVAFYFWEQFKFDDDNIAETSSLHLFGWILVILSCIQILLSTTGIFLTFTATKCLGIQQTSRNPLKMIVKVLVFAFKHKYPIKRSAFTYWENDIPSRIDLGKEKYGGPFTYEQVEDVKTMFRLLLLMFSSFGFYLSGDGYSLSHYILNTVGCPTFVPLIIMILNPENITNLVVVLFIPFYQLMKKYLSRYTPSLLARMWIGLFLCLLSECIQSSYSSFLQHERESLKCLQGQVIKNPTLELQCVFTNLKVLKNNTYEYFCSEPPINYPLIYLSLVPLILHSLSYLLVFLTTIEFICAQSPNAMKGLLIGIWYSMMSIKYIVVNNLNIRKNLLQTDSWSIYHGIRGVRIFVSIICFSFISKRYRYRERDENVNEQAIIEEQYERELLLNYSSEKI